MNLLGGTNASLKPMKKQKQPGAGPWLNNPMSYNGTQQRPPMGGLNPAWSDPPKPAQLQGPQSLQPVPMAQSGGLEPVPQAPAPTPIPQAPAGAQLGAPIGAQSQGQQQPAWMQQAVQYPGATFSGNWIPNANAQIAGMKPKDVSKAFSQQMLGWDTGAPPLNDKHIALAWSPLSEAFANAQRPGEDNWISSGEGQINTAWPGWGGSMDDYANSYFHNQGPYQQRIVIGPDGTPYVRSYETAPTDDFLGSLGAGFGFGGLFGPVVGPIGSNLVGSGMSGAGGTGP